MALERNPGGLHLVRADDITATDAAGALQPAQNLLQSVDEELGHSFTSAMRGQELPDGEHFLYAIQSWILQKGISVGKLSPERMQNAAVQAERTRDVREMNLPVSRAYMLRIAEFQKLHGLKGYVFTIHDIDFDGQECTLGQARSVVAYEQTSTGVWEQVADLQRKDPEMLTRSLGRRSPNFTDLYAVVHPLPIITGGPGERVRNAA